MERSPEQFIYNQSKITHLERIGENGTEAEIFLARFTEVDPKDGAQIKRDYIIKKFFPESSMHGGEIVDDRHLSETVRERLRDKCTFVSQTAALFRAEGLPVLPMVKSVITEKDIRALKPRLAKEFALVKPPYVVMSKLDEAPGVEEAELFDPYPTKFFAELAEHPELVTSLFVDLGKIHALGYFVGTLDDGYMKHPVQNLWLFTKDKKDHYDRVLVDLSNLTRNPDFSATISSHGDAAELAEYINRVAPSYNTEVLMATYDRAFEEKNAELARRK